MNFSNRGDSGRSFRGGLPGQETQYQLDAEPMPRRRAPEQGFGGGNMAGGWNPEYESKADYDAKMNNPVFQQRLQELKAKQMRGPMRQGPADEPLYPGDPGYENASEPERLSGGREGLNPWSGSGGGSMVGGTPLTDVQGLTGPGARRGGVGTTMNVKNFASGFGGQKTPPQMGSGGGNMAGGPPLTDIQGLTGQGARRAQSPPPQMGSGGGNVSIPPQTGGALANKPGFDMGFKKPAPQGMMTGSFARPRTLTPDNVAPQRTRPDDSGI